MRVRSLLVALSCAVLLLMMNGTVAFAASSPPKKKTHVQPAVMNCMTITNTGQTVDEISARFHGNVQNYTCDGNVTGTLRIYGDIRCDGNKKFEPPAPEYLPVPSGDEVAWSVVVTGSCLVCVDGEVTDTPSFYLDVYASYIGHDLSGMISSTRR